MELKSKQTADIFEDFTLQKSLYCGIKADGLDEINIWLRKVTP